MTDSKNIPESSLPADGKVGPTVSIDRVRMIVGGLLVGAAILGIVLYTHGTVQKGDGGLRPAFSSVSTPTSAELAQAQIDLFTLSPDQLQPLTPQDARAWNDALPFSRDPVRPVAPFVVPLADPADYHRAVDCLSAAVYYEAANESTEGKMGVAQVVLNRVRHPTYPKSVCAVVFEGSQRTTGCQFSFTCDGAMARRPSVVGWANARAVAEAALNGLVSGQVGAATHYHADYVAPYWAERMSKSAKIGAHIFYRFPGRWSEASGLSFRYAGLEPVIAKMAPLASPEDSIADPDPLPLDLNAPVMPEVILQQDSVQDLPATTTILPPVVQPSGEGNRSASTPVMPVPTTASAPERAVVQNPLTTTPGERRRGRLARPGS